MSGKKEAARVAYRRATDAICSLFVLDKILEEGGLDHAADRFRDLRQQLIAERDALEPYMPKLRKSG